MGTLLTSTARLVLNDTEARRVISLGRTPFTIGRSADSTLSLANPQVSREHASIDHDGAGFILHDLSSRHGTFVNGQRVISVRLRSGDTIDFGGGGETLVFEHDEGTPRTLISRISEAVANESAVNELETLSLFLKAAQSLSTFSATDDVMSTMLEYTIRITGAERGFVFLGESWQAFRLQAARDRTGALSLDRPAISYSIVRDAADSDSDFIVSDTAEEAAHGRDSLVLNAIRSVVAIPLRCRQPNGMLGLLYLDSHSGRNNFTGTSRATLHAIAHQAATLLENLRLLEMERESALLRKELELAASIQRQIIPQILPQFPFAVISGRSVPCASVGGDFYDVIPVPNGFVAVLADVCGKGIPAALLACMVQGMLHGQVHLQTSAGAPLAETIQALNTFVCARAPREKYVTLAILRYTHADPGEAQIELVNAGHVAPILIRTDGRSEAVSEGDMPAGLLDFASYHPIRLTLARGERLVLLSDGITEAEDLRGTQFGHEQLQRHLVERDVVGALFHGIEMFCDGTQAQDDQTVLVIERTT